MRKLRKNEGFTLAELLIVVAIIAVLVAVSIPIFTSQLEKSRESTDLANMRAAKAAGVAALLTQDYQDTDGSAAAPWTKASSGFYYSYYDAVNGVLVESTVNGYGKGTKLVGNENNTEMGYKPGTDYSKQVVAIRLYPDAENDADQVKVVWADGASS